MCAADETICRCNLGSLTRGNLQAHNIRLMRHASQADRALRPAGDWSCGIWHRGNVAMQTDII